ncbi:MAG: hypothetical protein BMS9Abin02_0357 [Anaerolineae bacterium]|nr:MAG: hypothetical protein BMS9Abin02_0357 [Anaerolineae bacterium]
MLILLTIWAVPRVVSQESETDWADPLNLSMSGSAIEPRVVIDTRGVSHVFWQDKAINSYYYSQGINNAWTIPVQVEVPFGTRSIFIDLDPEAPMPLFIPRLFADPRGLIHAFWLNGEDTLFYSQVPINEITNFEAWSPQQQLARFVANFSAAVDNRGNVKLSYISNQSDAGLPAGVYHRHLEVGAFEWTGPSLLYSSAYFQNMPREQANIQLAVGSQGDGSTIFVAWDNRAEEKVFLARSQDGGNSWSEPVIIDQRQPDDALGAVGPSKILVTTTNDSVLLIWQAGHGFDICSQYYQSSDDGGESWQEAAAMLEDFSGCPDQNDVVGLADDLVLLYMSFQDKLYLLAWNDNRWSDPQPLEMDEFIHPVTYRVVDFGCQQIGVLDQSQLQMVGCGSGSSGQTADIWQTSRNIGEIEDWFPAEEAWTEPIEIADGISALSYPQLVADTEGRIHAFWSQDGDRRRVIYYARSQDDQWTPPIPVLASADDDILRQRVVIGPNDRLLVGWVEGTGAAYFSQSSSDRATLPADWSTPLQLPSPEINISDLDIALDNQSLVYYIAYTIPFNENRGVYLTWSADEGKNWAPPTKVFNGAEAGWQVVGPPRISVSEDGTVYILWTELDIEAGEGLVTSKALYYSRSVDGGITFQEPELVDETPVIWNDLIYFDRSIHRLWQEKIDAGGALFHQYSLDNGQNWSSKSRVVNSVNPVGVAADSSGQLHVIEIGDNTLNHTVWNGSIWTPEESVKIPAAMIEGASSNEVDVAPGPDQLLATLFSGQTIGPDEEQQNISLFSTWRNVELLDEPLIIATVPSSLEPIETPPVEAETVSPDVTPLVTSTPSPTSDISNATNNQPAENSGLFNIDNPIVKWALVMIPVAFLLLAVILLVVRTYRSSRP